MNQIATRPNGNAQEVTILEQVVLGGDLQQLRPAERINYYREVCSSLGLNPLTQPFQYIKLNGKLVLYARKDCADQLRSTRGVSITGIVKENIGDLYVVTASAQLPNGRTDEEIGAVNVKGLFGENLANAMMKACTKAKRRVTLSICGLGMLDETEVETIRDARPVHVDQSTGEIIEEAPRTPVQRQPRRAKDPDPAAMKHERLDGELIHPQEVDPGTQRPAAPVYRNEDDRQDFEPRTTAEDAALGKHMAWLKGWMLSRKAEVPQIDPDNREMAIWLLNWAAGDGKEDPGWTSRKELSDEDWADCKKTLIGTKPADLALWVQAFQSAQEPKDNPFSSQSEMGADGDGSAYAIEPCPSCHSTGPVGSCDCTLDDIHEARMQMAQAEAEAQTDTLLDVPTTVRAGHGSH
jgi:hypothetical protein